ncbi:hypothetical protein F4810DRAFT_685886 [Camillea tinctor]|nr:hypothetical protein F4810DRAFT_685886 [Camillea tinctor]
MMLRWNSTISYDHLAKRRKAPSPVKSAHDMYLLDKPIYIKPLSGYSSDLAKDVRALHDQIRNIGDFKMGIFPGEIRDRIEAFADRTMPSTCFREPDLADTPGALATFAALCRVVDATAVSQSVRRYEDAWNNLIHTPLLDLVFGSHPLNIKRRAQEQVQEQKCVSVRFEPVMAATIAYEWIPRLRRGPISEQIKKNTNLSDLACSVSAGSAISCTSSQLEGASHISVPKDLMHTSADSKKVDYVLVLDILDGTPLKMVISDLIQKAAVKAQETEGILKVPPAHVNQTTYHPIRDSPIAVSIETKQDFSSRDPLLQLGIWIAAWHRRMKVLYSARSLDILDDQFRNASTSDQPTISRPPDTVPPPNPALVSLPLIVATGHHWQIYFACDQDVSIELYGPLTIGSTATILDVYVLLCSLQAIKEWVETIFYTAIKSWFQCNK